jgi:hypothetical protein
MSWYPEDGGNKFLRNVNNMPDCTKSPPDDNNIHNHRDDKPKFQLQAKLPLERGT